MTDHGERSVVARSEDGPMTLARITEGLEALGVRPLDRLLVHASLSAFGFVAGGAQTVAAALKTVVGPSGLLVMPAFTGQLSDPCNWSAPPVPESWWPVIRSHSPAFDPVVTPPRGMGAVCELLRTSPGAVRGSHPAVSFTALGRDAAPVVEPHKISAWLGEGSPLQRLYDLDAKVLFLGVGFATCTAFHLGEHRADALTWRPDGAPLSVEGRRTWAAFQAPDYDTEGFAALGAAFEAQGGVAVVRLGAAACRLFSIRSAVDFAERWAASRRP